MTGYGPDALHIAGNNKQVGRVARQAVNSRGYFDADI